MNCKTILRKVILLYITQKVILERFVSLLNEGKLYKLVLKYNKENKTECFFFL